MSLDLKPEVLPKSPSGAAVRYALNQWEALTRFLEDGEQEIDNGATERANRDVLSRIPAHSITRLSELLPRNWKPATSPAETLH